MRSWLLPWLIVALPGQLPVQDPPIRPFADYEDTGYVFMAARDASGARDLKRAIARHLPDDVTLVLYGHSAKDADREKILADYRAFMPADRLEYVALPKAKDGFWSRDGLPVPMIDRDGRLVLVDAKYWTGFEPDAAIAGLFDAPLRSHRHRFEGGNFLANHHGACFIVNAGTAKKVPDEVFLLHYGCRFIARLPKHGGIGHIDERARFVDADTVLTDTPEYAPAFAARGLHVVTLPRPRDSRQSYVNALVVNGTAFVPQFGGADDQAAVDVYRRTGLSVVALDSHALSKKLRGSLHCLSMNYPRVALPGRGTSAPRIR